MSKVRTWHTMSFRRNWTLEGRLLQENVHASKSSQGDTMELYLETYSLT
jgi:hypothetical protein